MNYILQYVQLLIAFLKMKQQLKYIMFHTMRKTEYFFQRMFEDPKGITRSNKLMKDRQNNDQKKKGQVKQ